MKAKKDAEKLTELVRATVVRMLTEDNPRTPRDAVEVYAGAFLEYVTAARNIAEHGSIVFHPRTGAPIENPYLRIRTGAEKTMLGCRIRQTARLWDLAGLSS